MRGLIYRELYLARKSYIGGLIAVAMFVVLGVLVRMSLLYGNLADLEPDAYKMVDLVSYIAFSYLPLVLLFIPFAGDGGVSISDYKSKWMLYEYTLPYNEKQLAGVKYIIKIGLMMLAFLLAFGNLLLFGGLSGQGIRGNATQDIEGIGVYNMEWNSIKILLIVMMLVTLISAFTTPMLLRYKSTNAVVIRIVIVAVVLYFVFAGYLVSHMTKVIADDLPIDQILNELFELIMQLRDKLAIASPFVMILALLAGFWLTVRQLKKREVM